MSIHLRSGIVPVMLSPGETTDPGRVTWAALGRARHTPAG